MIICVELCELWLEVENVFLKREKLQQQNDQSREKGAFLTALETGKQGCYSLQLWPGRRMCPVP